MQQAGDDRCRLTTAMRLWPGDRVTVLASGRTGTVLDGACGPDETVVVLPDRLPGEKWGAVVVKADRAGVREINGVKGEVEP